MKILVFGLFLISIAAHGQVDRITAKSMFEILFSNWQEMNRGNTFQGMDQNKDYDQIQFIGLERTGCYGTCPVYEFLVRNNGEVEYVGFANVEKIGRYRGQISELWKLNNLFKYIMEIEYFNFQNIYRARRTDSATVYTMVRIGSGSKAIMNYGNGGPAELWALEQLMDQVIEEVEWREM